MFFSEHHFLNPWIHVQKVLTELEAQPKEEMIEGDNDGQASVV